MKLTDQQIVTAIILGILLSGCAASVDIQKIKLQSGREYEVAKTRSGVEFADCGTQLVSYLFDEKGTLLDSKSERGQALHCDVGVALIRAGGEIGAANQIRRGIAAGADSISTINNNLNEQSQLQSQLQGQVSNNVNKNVNKNSNTNSNTTKVKNIGGSSEGGSSKHGNNGKGNGSGDGTNPGTNNHHNNGDND